MGHTKNYKFVVSLKAAHDSKGLSAYRVGLATGLSANTVRKYADVDHVISEYIPPAVPILAAYYGVDWRDGLIVRLVEIEDDEAEMKTPVTAIA